MNHIRRPLAIIIGSVLCRSPAKIYLHRRTTVSPTPPPHPTAIFVGARLALRGLPPGKNICYGKNGFASSDIEKKSKQPKVHYHYHSSTVPSVYIIYILHFGVLAILHIRCQPTGKRDKTSTDQKACICWNEPENSIVRISKLIS